ncbi:hypothetical protein HPP92_001572 [Vanilla planifolia]|uniref:Uncharacterized protein n=1 Tax=Vanilla planifolia TaxID=51239 RepID=A0A835RZJ4_VANPL|nr:hypothetical protein HPP92_001572 [Vanilla planifolia]
MAGKKIQSQIPHDGEAVIPGSIQYRRIPNRTLDKERSIAKRRKNSWRRRAVGSSGF